MAGLNLKQLLEKAKQAMKDNSPSDCFLQLKESLRDDFYWEAMSVEFKGKDMDNIEEVKMVGYGQTPEEALNELIGKLSPFEDLVVPPYYNIWKEIEMDTDFDFAVPKIELPKLRIILEKHNILKDEKDGM